MTIPHKLHNAIIGAKGRLIRSIMDDCGGVTIKFPPGGSNSDKVIVRGPKDDVQKAKNELLQLAKEKVNCWTEQKTFGIGPIWAGNLNQNRRSIFTRYSSNLG